MGKIYLPFIHVARTIYCRRGAQDKRRARARPRSPSTNTVRGSGDGWLIDRSPRAQLARSHSGHHRSARSSPGFRMYNNNMCRPSGSGSGICRARPRARRAHSCPSLSLRAPLHFFWVCGRGEGDNHDMTFGVFFPPCPTTRQSVGLPWQTVQISTGDTWYYIITTTTIITGRRYRRIRFFSSFSS